MLVILPPYKPWQSSTVHCPFLLYFCYLSLSQKGIKWDLMPLLKHLVWTLSKPGVIKSLPWFQISSLLWKICKVIFPWLFFLFSPDKFSLLYRPIATGERYKCSLQTGHCPGNCEMWNWLSEWEGYRIRAPSPQEI